MKKGFNFLFAVVAISISLCSACTKATTEISPNPTDNIPVKGCENFTFSLSSGSTSTNGVIVRKILVTATGGTNIQYNINTGAFQNSGTFENLNPGVYTVTAKNNEGCTRTGTVTF
jgi:hypothetical protein